MHTTAAGKKHSRTFSRLKRACLYEEKKMHSHVPRKHKTLLVHKLGKERFNDTLFSSENPAPYRQLGYHSEGAAYYTNVGTYCSKQQTLPRIQVPHELMRYLGRIIQQPKHSIGKKSCFI